MKVAFSVFDRNEDGKISKDELAEVLKEADVVFTDEQLTDFMEKVDKDGTHSLTHNFSPTPNATQFFHFRIHFYRKTPAS